MLLLQLNCTCSQHFRLWFGSHIWYCRQHAIRQSEVRGKGRQRSCENWSSLRLPLKRYSYSQIILPRLFISYMIWVVYHTRKRIGYSDCPALPSPHELPTTDWAIHYSYLHVRAELCKSAICVWAKGYFKYNYLACTSLSEIRLLLNNIIFILFIPISFLMPPVKRFLNYFDKKVKSN